MNVDFITWRGAHGYPAKLVWVVTHYQHGIVVVQCDAEIQFDIIVPALDLSRPYSYWTYSAAGNCVVDFNQCVFYGHIDSGISYANSTGTANRLDGLDSLLAD